MIKDAFFLYPDTGNYEDQEIIWNIINDVKTGEKLVMRTIPQHMISETEVRVLAIYLNQEPTIAELVTYHNQELGTQT